MIKELSKSDQLKVINEARTRFSFCQDYYKESRMLSDEDEKFTFGDSDNLFQWVDRHNTPDLLEQSQADGDVMLTINIVAQHKNQVVNSFKQGKPTGRVIAKGGGATAKSAKVMEGILRHIKNSNNTDDKIAQAYDSCVDTGEGYVWWRTEYESDESFNLVLRNSYMPRNCIYIDPNATEPDNSDATYGFIFREVTKDSLETTYGIKNATSWEADGVFIKEKNALIAVYYWCETESDTLEQYSDGSTGYKSKNKDGKLVINKRKVQVKTWYWAKIVGGHDELYDYDEWFGKYLPIVSMVGVEKVIDGKYYVKGKTRDLKDHNRTVNYAWSSAIEALSAQPKHPYLVPVEMLNAMPENLKSLWDAPNKSRLPYLPYVSRDPSTLEQIAPPSREQTAYNPSAHINVMQIALDNINSVSGLHNSNFGQEAPQKSGIAIQRQAARGETSNYHFVDQAQIALRYQERILLDLVPKIYTEEQVIRIVDFQGKEHDVYIDPNMQEPAIENNGQKEGASMLESVKYAFNPQFGLYDVEIDTGASWPTQKQETNTMLQELSRANPGYMVNFSDFMFQTMDTIYSDEMAERARKMLPPQLQDEKGNQEIPPQIKAQMEEMNNALEGASQHVQELDKQNKETQKRLSDLETQNQILKIKEQELQSLLRVTKAMPQEEKEPEAYTDQEHMHDTLELQIFELSSKIDMILQKELGEPEEINEPQENPIEMEQPQPQPEGMMNDNTIQQ